MVENSRLVQRLLDLPQWLAVGIVVLVSLAGSIMVTVILKLFLGQPIQLFVPYMLYPTIVSILVSAPVSAFVLGLMHRLQAAHAEAERLSHTDMLTGAPNRRRFMAIAQDILARSRSARAAVAVLLLDIDDFKRFNDTHGHDAGDALLKMVSSVIASTLRPGEPFARWGGEEFVVLLPGAGSRQAIGIALCLRDAIAAARVPVGDQHLAVTASIGVSVVEDGNSTLENLVTRADHAMYESKRSGKNTATIAEPNQASARTPSLPPAGIPRSLIKASAKDAWVR